MQKKRSALPDSANAVHKAKSNIQHPLNGARGAAVTNISSMRLTKDVDFGQAGGVSTASVQSNVKRALQYAAQSAGLRSAAVDPRKARKKARKLLSVCGSPGQFLQRWFGLWWTFQAATQFRRIAKPGSR